MALSALHFPQNVFSDSQVMAVESEELDEVSQGQEEVLLPEPDSEHFVTHEIPNLKIENGPGVEVLPGPGCCEENIQALAHTTVLALHQTLQELGNLTDQQGKEEVAQAQESIAVAQEEVGEAIQASSEALGEIGEAVVAVGDMLVETGEAVVSAIAGIPTNVEVFLNFLIEKYGLFVEYLSNGWKLMLYDSVEGATRQFVELAVTRSGAVDLSAFNALDETAHKCLHRMDVIQAELLEAAGAQSEALRSTVECYLGQYRDWFTGKSEALIDSQSTANMLNSLGVRGVDVSEFSLKNLEKFSELGGVARHQNLYFSIRPLDLVVDEPVRSLDEEAVAEVRAVLDSEATVSAMTNELVEEAVSRDIADVAVRSCEEDQE